MRDGFHVSYSPSTNGIDVDGSPERIISRIARDSPSPSFRTCDSFSSSYYGEKSRFLLRVGKSRSNVERLESLGLF